MSNTIHLTGLANHLVYDGLLDEKNAIQWQKEALQNRQPFICYLIKNNILSSQTILESCSKTFGLSVVNLDDYDVNEILDINSELIQRYRFAPLKKQNNTLSIGISDPTDREGFAAISFSTGFNLSLCLVSEEQLENYLNTFRSLQKTVLELNLLKELAHDENHSLIKDNSVNYDEPLIRFVDHIIRHAFQQSASDIHIEPYQTICRIRYRQDGILYEIAEIPINLSSRLVTRLKVMSKLDISERRLPQDGRLQFDNIDIRINTCPTLFGEKVVLRLLDVKKISLEIHELGLTEIQKTIFLNKISQPQGLILVTGPTGSGKTVTLYSALNFLNNSEKNISTVEDPVEIQLRGINQVNVNPKINLHFAHVLRTFLRQDPDIIMVGEIRDSETAEIAIQAAQTGHLVLSTLHTNSALEAITRLQSMKVAAYNIIHSISLIIAQRLARKLCHRCKQPEIVSTNILETMGFSHSNVERIFFRAVGCRYCQQGYKGRIGIYEFLPMTDNIAQFIITNQNIANMKSLAKREGFSSLRDNSFEKLSQGLTSLAEINRVIPI